MSEKIIRSIEPRDILPDDTANHDGLLTAQLIREKTRRKGTKERTTGHSRSDSTLDI